MTPLYIFLLIFVCASWYGVASAASSDHVMFPSNSTLHGLSFKDWAAKWWVWWAGIPNDIHPVQKFPDAARCAAMQNGPVWFMPSAQSGEGEMNFQCNIPQGKDIMFDLSATECENGGVEGTMTDDELRTCAFNINTPLSNIEFILDGTKIDVGKLGQPLQSDFFNIAYPENPVTIWGPVKPGTYRALSEGYYLFLHDLPPGKHIVKYKVADILKGSTVQEPPTIGTFDILVK